MLLDLKTKKPFDVIRKFQKIHNQVDAKLLLVGYGTEKKITKFINENKLKNKVIVVKDYKNVFKYYKLADLFVLTSLYEGFGNVLVEAGTLKFQSFQQIVNRAQKKF